MYLTDLKLLKGNARVNVFASSEYLTKAILEKQNHVKLALVDSSLKYSNRALLILPKLPDALGDKGSAFFNIGSIDSAEYS